jgi:hypothetical protein
MTYQRTTHTGLAGVMAECQDCPWKTYARNGLGNAARHADATGHYVQVEQTTLINYNRPAEDPQT